MPPDKNPGLQSIGVGEVLRRMAWEDVKSIVKDDVTRQLRIYSYEVGKMQDVRSLHIRCMTYLEQTRQKQF